MALRMLVRMLASLEVFGRCVWELKCILIGSLGTVGRVWSLCWLAVCARCAGMFSYFFTSLANSFIIFCNREWFWSFDCQDSYMPELVLSRVSSFPSAFVLWTKIAADDLTAFWERQIKFKHGWSRSVFDLFLQRLRPPQFARAKASKQPVRTDLHHFWQARTEDKYAWIWALYIVLQAFLGISWFLSKNYIRESCYGKRAHTLNWQS